MLRLGTVVLGVDDVDQAVAFWSHALGYEPFCFPESENQFTILIPPSGEGTRVALQRADTPTQEHPRVQWNLYPADPDFVVLADPDGNRFCIVDSSHG